VESKFWGFTDEKAFCNSILSATINDQDKYQLGLTKIFFRAGSLALLESLRTQRLNYLVTLVQKNVKRMLARRDYVRMKTAAIKLQSWWRGEMGRRMVAELRRQKAAVLIQKIIRGYMERQRFLALRASVTKAQACEFMTRSHRKGGSSLNVVTSDVRGYQARVRFREARTQGAALLLQSLWRGV
jgi:myosin V